MKSKNLIRPLLVTASLMPLVTPLTTLSSCSKKDEMIDLLEIYTPTIESAETQWFETTNDALKAYLTAIDSENGGNPEIFIQDLYYTMSKGMQQYYSVYQQFCTTSRAEFLIKASNVRVKNVDNDDPTKVERKVIFDLDISAHFDVSKTNIEDLIWLEIGCPIYDIDSKVEFTFDFNTADATDTNFGGSEIYQYRRMSSLCSATQFGITEYGSQLRVLSEHGTTVDLYGKETIIDNDMPSSPYYFVLPTYGYWERKVGKEQAEQEYNARYNSCYSLWNSHQGAQTAVLTIKYYISAIGDPTESDTAIRVLDFGSHYFANANLNNFYTTTKEVQENETIGVMNGFSFSLDAKKNYKNIEKIKDQPDLDGRQGFFDSTTQTFKLPIRDYADGYNLTAIGQDAFSSAKSEFTNMSFPSQVLNANIPKEYTLVRTGGFKTNYVLKTISFEKRDNGNYIEFEPDSISQMLSLIELDFSKQDDDGYGPFTYTDLNTAFTNIHKGADLNTLTAAVKAKYGQEYDGAEGVILIPQCDDEDFSAWESKMDALGLSIWHEGQADKHGWAIIQKQ